MAYFFAKGIRFHAPGSKAGLKPDIGTRVQRPVSLGKYLFYAIYRAEEIKPPIPNKRALLNTNLGNGGP